MAGRSSDVVVVMVPFPEYGHLTPLLRLSRLISSYDIPVHYATYGARIQELKLQLLDWKLEQFPNIHFHDLCVDDDFAELNRSLILLNEPLFALCRELISNSCKRLVVIHDTFMYPSVQLVHMELSTKVEMYMFHGFPALTLYSWIQQASRKDDYDSLFLPLEPYFPSIETCCPPQFPEYVKMVSDWASKSAGEILNTCRELEGPYLDALAKLSGKPVWGLGPLNPVTIESSKQGEGSNNTHKCIEWLHKQPKRSVILVSFGTSTTLSPEQINELAIGLERCEHKFIWVLRSKGIRGNASTMTETNTPKIELPTGFEERVAERGMIARDWVPQLEVLAHPSTGGYLFHSGWGSLMESIAMGVPMATWPMHSDHPFNEVAITKVLKVGIPIKDRAEKEELVTSNAIANALKTLMNSPQGGEMRQRVTELSQAINKSWSEGGTTQKQMESFIAHITR